MKSRWALASAARRSTSLTWAESGMRSDEGIGEPQYEQVGRRRLARSRRHLGHLKDIENSLVLAVAKGDDSDLAGDDFGGQLREGEENGVRECDLERRTEVTSNSRDRCHHDRISGEVTPGVDRAIQGID